MLNALVVNVATPPDRLPLLRVAAPSLNATVPDGLTPPLTVAVKVTLLPNTEGFGDDIKAVVVCAAAPPVQRLNASHTNEIVRLRMAFSPE